MLLHARFIENAKKHPGKTAIIDRTTGRTVTYGRALIASLILSDKFSEFDEGFIGLMLPTSAGCALSSVAALMSGRTPVMINYSTGAVENSLYAQRKCDFTTIVTSRALLKKIGCPHVDGMVYLEDIMDSIGKADKLKAALLSKLPVRLILARIKTPSEDDDAVILFTSGSEKDPKAVELTHKNLSSNIEGFAKTFSFGPEDTALANLPFFHVFGLTVTMWMPLYFGMKLVTYANPLEYAEICKVVREEKPTLMVGTPSFLWGYLRKSGPGDFQSVRVLVSGADKCPDALRKAYRDKHGMTLYEGYGTTETSPVISVNYTDNNTPGSVGRPIPGIDVRIEDYESGKTCDPDGVGRILVKGDSVMKGYFDDMEETSMRIRHGWYDTGDMGFIDEKGFLWHSGRLKRFVKIGGEMVSLVRVEDRLEKVLPENVECCVVEIPDQTKGARIVAALTGEINEKETIKKLSVELPNIALPKQFVIIEEFPKMGSGKINFREVTDIVHKMLHRKGKH